MACGVAVICSDSVGARDLIRDNIDGFIIPCRDTEKLKEKYFIFMKIRISAQAWAGPRGKMWPIILPGIITGKELSIRIIICQVSLNMSILNSKYDVIIVGAGPIGIYASTRLCGGRF